MNNISQNIRYYPHDLNTKFYSVQLYLKGFPRKSNGLKTILEEILISLYLNCMAN